MPLYFLLHDAQAAFVFSVQGYLLQGLAYQHMGEFKDAVNSLLVALDLDPDNADKLTNHIAATVIKYCGISKDLAKSLRGGGQRKATCFPLLVVVDILC